MNRIVVLFMAILICCCFSLCEGDLRDCELYEAAASRPEAEAFRKIENLLDAGYSVNGKCGSGDTALFRTSWFLNARVVQLLLERGADPNIRNDNGKTALWLALQVGCHDPKKGLPVIKLLLEAGADVNIRDNEGQTPLQWAVSYTCPKKEVADLLLSYARRKK